MRSDEGNNEVPSESSTGSVAEGTLEKGEPAREPLFSQQEREKVKAEFMAEFEELVTQKVPGIVSRAKEDARATAEDIEKATYGWDLARPFPPGVEDHSYTRVMAAQKVLHETFTAQRFGSFTTSTDRIANTSDGSPSAIVAMEGLLNSVLEVDYASSPEAGNAVYMWSSEAARYFEGCSAALEDAASSVIRQLRGDAAACLDEAGKIAADCYKELEQTPYGSKGSAVDLFGLTYAQVYRNRVYQYEGQVSEITSSWKKYVDGQSAQLDALAGVCRSLASSIMDRYITREAERRTTNADIVKSTE
jgi:hypothetical protein